MGYTGGTTINPTYNSLGDHTESIQIDYDPGQINYRELLDIFLSAHNPLRSSWSRQYKAAIFFHDENQREMAQESLNREAALRGEKILTEILPLTRFSVAEDYHQKYRLRHESVLMEEYKRIYSDETEFMNSTAAARINGYLGGYGTPEVFSSEISNLGLSQRAKEVLIGILSESRPAFRNCPLR